jgi:hypothetical protein
MTTLATALKTAFTPTATEFSVQVIGGSIELLRKQTSGATLVSVGQIKDQAVIVQNPTSGCVYEMHLSSGNPTVQADE